MMTAPDATLWVAQTEGRSVMPGDDSLIAVPSGQAVSLQEIIIDTPPLGAPVYRFRYLAPAIARSGGAMTFESSIPDFQHLCERDAVPRLPAPTSEAVQIVISFADISVPFGTTNTDATQFFVAFSLTDGLCMVDTY